jgi:hypothetical protein
MIMTALSDSGDVRMNEPQLLRRKQVLLATGSVNPIVLS